MAFNRLISLAAVASAAALLPGAPAFAAELVFGSWTPAQEYQNRVVMPELFRNIEKDTNGAIKWKLIAGGQIADGKTTFTAVKDGLMQAGLGIVTYVPNADSVDLRDLQHHHFRRERSRWPRPRRRWKRSISIARRASTNSRS